MEGTIMEIAQNVTESMTSLSDLVRHYRAMVEQGADDSWATTMVARIWEYVEPLIRAQAYHLARKYSSTLGIDDLVHEAYFGFVRALEKYDARRASFETYCRYWTQQAIIRAILNSREPRIPEYAVMAHIQVVRLRDEGYRDTGVSPSLDPDTVSKQLGISGPAARTVMHPLPMCESLDNLTPKRLETLTTTSSWEDDETASTRERSVAIAQALKELSEREQEVVRSIVGYGGPCLSAYEIGKILGVSPKRVRAIFNQAVKKLRSNDLLVRLVTTPARETALSGGASVG